LYVKSQIGDFIFRPGITKSVIVNLATVVVWYASEFLEDPTIVRRWG